MRHAVVLGATGRVGSWLVPRLMQAGYAVSAVTRGRRQPAVWHDAWHNVPGYPLDRATTTVEGVFGDEIAGLAPDVVIDLLPPNLVATEQLTQALTGSGVLLVQAGCITVHGPCGDWPASEEEALAPLTESGRAGLSVMRHLLQVSSGVEACVVLAGYLVGPGGATLNPAGNYNATVIDALRGGEAMALPGAEETRLQFIHTEDVARLIMACLDQPERSMGEAFHAVAPPITQRAYAEAVVPPDTPIRFVELDEWATQAEPADVALSRAVLTLNAHCSGEKARERLGFTPEHDVLSVVQGSTGDCGKRKA